MDSFRRLRLAVILAAAGLAVGATPALAASFTVDSTADAVDATPGDGVCASASNGCTLRAAVQEANALAGADEVDVPAGTYRLTLTGKNEDADLTGDLDVTSDLTVVGADGRSVVLTARAPMSSTTDFQTIIDVDRVFDVIAGGSLALSKVTLDGGHDTQGGIIRAAGPLSLTDATVADGLASVGAGIWSSAPVSLNRVTLDGNRASSDGGGVASSGGLSVLNSTVAGNVASGNGGGIAVLGGTADIANASLAMNLANSDASLGGQIYNGGATQIRNSILERTTPSAPNCGGNPISSGGHNVDDDGSCGFTAAGDRGINFFGWTNYKLTNAGGESDVLLPFSWPTNPVGAGPAVDIGGEGCPPIDQRGVARPQGASCDAGAYEAQFADLTLTAGPVPARVTAGTPFSFSLGVGNGGPAPATVTLSWTSTTPFVLTRDGVQCPPSDCPGTLAAGQAITLVASGKAPASGTISATLSTFNDSPIAQAALDPSDSNSKVTISIPVVAPPAAPLPQAPKPGACANVLAGTTGRADVLKGTAYGDLIRGGRGNDKLYGLAGGDCLDGGAGNDVLSGGAGNDKLTGGPGRDKINGGAGNDVIKAADHTKDVVDCGPGRDRAIVDRIDRIRRCEKITRRR